MPNINSPLNTRRDVLSGLGAFTLATASPLSVRRTSSRNPVQGRVLNAHTGDGIANVMVSDGCNIAVTDRKGAYTIEAPEGQSIFVIKPPQWTYRDASGVPLINANERGYDFYLRPQVERDAFEVALIADTQAANARELDYVRREIERNLQPGAFAFAISHGDVMGDDLSLFAPYKEIVRSTGMIWHHCPGNHDLDLSAPANEGALLTWERQIGPSHYTFQYANATFILLNNVEYFGAGAERIDGRHYRGRIGERQLSFVRNVLKNVPKDHLVAVSMHIPLVSFENPQAAGDNTADRAELLKILSEYPNTVSFSGHSHTTEHHYLGAEDGFHRHDPHHHHVLTAFCGSWWGGPLNSYGVPVSDSRDGSPRGFHVLRVEGNTYRTRFVPIGDSGDNVARLSALPVESKTEAPGTSGRRLTVDVFDGGPKTKISCLLGGATDAVELQRAAIPDPHIVESYARHRDLLKPWVSAAPSSHMWTLPAPVEPGQLCTFDITNEYGLTSRLQTVV